MKDRETRRLDHTKQRGTGVKEGAVNKEEIPENVPVIRYLPGSGLYSIIKFKNRLYFSEFIPE